MGGNASKPLRDSARTVLARRQIPVASDLPTPPQITPSIQHADSVHAHPTPSTTPFQPTDVPVDHFPATGENLNANQEQENHNYSTSPNISPPVPPSAFDQSGAPLPPDLLAAISKWQVRKNVGSNPYIKSATGKSIEIVRFRSTAEIRNQKDLEMSKREQEGLPLIGRLTEMQIHEFYKIARDDPHITAEEIAAKFHLTENMAHLLLEVARLPVIVTNEDKSETVAH